MCELHVGELGGTRYEIEDTPLYIIEEEQNILKIRVVSKDIVKTLKQGAL
jgi:hypothetical protein